MSTGIRTYYLTTLYGNHAPSNIRRDYIFVITATKTEANACMAVNGNIGRTDELTPGGLALALAQLKIDCGGLNYRIIDLAAAIVASEPESFTEKLTNEDIELLNKLGE